MTFSFQDTRLWRESLGLEASDDAANRSHLANAYLAFRERAAVLAGEIPLDLRDYTVHDVTHLDALWEMADLVAGESVALTPTEAFVLGGAFLVHDLGMGLAAYPGGMDELTSQPAWRDILAASIHEILGRPGTAEDLENPSLEALARAKETALRELHASRAADLAMVAWPDPSTGQELHLIDDYGLRQTYGPLVGELAASHWYDVDEVAERFAGPVLGAPVDFPSSWTVDPLRLACLVRLADACHLDARRAPAFLRAVRRPTGVAADHWEFQGHMQRAQVEGDDLVYTAAPAFPSAQAGAWWVCHDSLSMVNDELGKVDRLLEERGRARLQAKGVRGIESPRRLSSFIPTTGWTPVDARVVVSNVPLLARRLGGESLYGDQPHVALRELIQNARDATRALAELLDTPPHPIEIALRSTAGDWWLEVADRGIGMSERVLVGTLLDFGRSYWGSQLMRSENPGLAASTFRAVGKFGIGFYAVFMIGDQVRVTTRRYDEASADTRVLEFLDGLDARPILRPATPDERLHEGGTRVAVRLAHDPGEMGGLLRTESPWERFSLEHLCAWLAPALDCDLIIRDEESPAALAIRAGDWLDVEPSELFARLSRPSRHAIFPNAHVSEDLAGAALQVIQEEDKPIARLALAPSPPAIRMADGSVRVLDGVVVSGGLRVASIGGAAGIVEGTPIKADRNSAAITPSADSLRVWASHQAEHWRDELNEHRGEADICVNLLVRLKAELGEIQLCHDRDRYLTTSELHRWAANRSEVVLCSAYSVHASHELPFRFFDYRLYEQIVVDDHVLFVRDGGRYGDWDAWGNEFPDTSWAPTDLDEHEELLTSRYWWYVNQLSPSALVLRTIGDAWGLSIPETLDRLSSFREDRWTRVGARPSGDESTAIVQWRISR